MIIDCIQAAIWISKMHCIHGSYYVKTAHVDFFEPPASTSLWYFHQIMNQGQSTIKNKDSNTLIIFCCFKKKKNSNQASMVSTIRRKTIVWL